MNLLLYGRLIAAALVAMWAFPACCLLPKSVAYHGQSVLTHPAHVNTVRTRGRTARMSQRLPETEPEEERDWWRRLAGDLFPKAQTPEEKRRREVAAQRRRDKAARRAPNPYLARNLPAQEEETQKPVGNYIPPEDCPSGRLGEINIVQEQKIQFEAQRRGNRLRQHDILTETLKREG